MPYISRKHDRGTCFQRHPYITRAGSWSCIYKSFPSRHTHSFHINRNTAADSSLPPSIFWWEMDHKDAVRQSRLALLHCFLEFEANWGNLQALVKLSHTAAVSQRPERERLREREKERGNKTTTKKIPTNYLPSLRADLRCCHGDGLHADTMGWEREREREGWRGFWENKICDVERQILQWFIIICIVKNLSTQFIFHPFIVRFFFNHSPIYPSIHPAISIFIHLSKYWSIYPSINLFFINPPIHPFSHPSIFICSHLSISIFIHPSINQSINPSTFLIYPSIHPSIYLFFIHSSIHLSIAFSSIHPSIHPSTDLFLFSYIHLSIYPLLFRPFFYTSIHSSSIRLSIHSSIQLSIN